MHAHSPLKFKVMKKAVTIIISGALLAACSTSNKVTNGGIFQKRKYNKGIFLDIATNKKGIEKSKKDNGSLYHPNGEAYVSKAYVTNTESATSEELSNTLTNNLSLIVDNSTVIYSKKSIKNVLFKNDKQNKSNIVLSTRKSNIQKEVLKKVEKNAMSAKGSDADKFLKLALIFLGVSILLFILMFVVPLGGATLALWILASLSGFVAFIFFIIWLVKALS